jgi:hypothetical protein
MSENSYYVTEMLLDGETERYFSMIEPAASREALLRYCELDTWAMVKVWEKLKKRLALFEFIERIDYIGFNKNLAKYR